MAGPECRLRIHGGRCPRLEIAVRSSPHRAARGIDNRGIAGQRPWGQDSRFPRRALAQAVRVKVPPRLIISCIYRGHPWLPAGRRRGRAPDWPKLGVFRCMFESLSIVTPVVDRSPPPQGRRCLSFPSLPLSPNAKRLDDAMAGHRAAVDVVRPAFTPSTCGFPSSRRSPWRSWGWPL